MRGEQRETDEQAEQVHEDHPLVTEVAEQAEHSAARRETGDEEFVQRDDRQARHRNLQRSIVKDRDPDECEAEEDEVDRNAEARDFFDVRRPTHDGHDDNRQQNPQRGHYA